MGMLPTGSTPVWVTSKGSLMIVATIGVLGRLDARLDQEVRRVKEVGDPGNAVRFRYETGGVFANRAAASAVGGPRGRTMAKVLPRPDRDATSIRPW